MEYYYYYEEDQNNLLQEIIDEPFYYPEESISNYDSCVINNNNNSTTMSYIPNNPTTSSSSSYSNTYVQMHQPAQQQQQQQLNTTQMLKRKMRLDLDGGSGKRPRSSTTNTTMFSNNSTLNDACLSTPDVQKLALPSPDLERMIMNNTNPLQTPTSLFFPKNVTEEQELYAKGFEHALQQLHESNNATTTSSSFGDDDDDSTTSSYTNKHNYNSNNKNVPAMHDFSNVIVKEEPQTVPDEYDNDDDDDDDDIDEDDSSECGSSGRNIGNSSISPIDMETQEKIKLERKRQRNRLAASKCRKRKLERIAKLEDKVKQLKSENSELGNMLVKLRETVVGLKSQVMEHVQAGCPIVVNINGLGLSGNNNNFS